MNDKKTLDKFAFFLPNSFTAMNIGCGYLAMMFAIKGSFYNACIMIILGAIFDSVDGRLARMTGTQSSFGEQFDSLSDLISFGIAPAFIFYNRFLVDYGRAGMVVSFLFLLCAALRLARLNANIGKTSGDYFEGLPSPGAASALIGFTLISLEFSEYVNTPFIAFPFILLFALLMISKIPFPSFKSSPWVKNNKRKVLFIIFIIAASLFVYEEIMILFWISAYTLGSLIFYSFNKSKIEDAFDWQDEKN